MKTPRTFRLSPQASDALAYMAEQTGSSETAIVEQAVLFYSEKVAQTVRNRLRSQAWAEAHRMKPAAARPAEKPPTTSGEINDLLEGIEGWSKLPPPPAPRPAKTEKRHNKHRRSHRH